jgi:hypothetical protein
MLSVSSSNYFIKTGYFCASLLSGITSIALALLGIGLILGAFAACGLHLYDVILKKPGLIPVVILLETPLCITIFGSLGMGALWLGREFFSYARKWSIEVFS